MLMSEGMTRPRNACHKLCKRKSHELVLLVATLLMQRSYILLKLTKHKENFVQITRETFGERKDLNFFEKFLRNLVCYFGAMFWFMLSMTSVTASYATVCSVYLIVFNPLFILFFYNLYFCSMVINKGTFAKFVLLT